MFDKLVEFPLYSFQKWEFHHCDFHRKEFSVLRSTQIFKSNNVKVIFKKVCNDKMAWIHIYVLTHFSLHDDKKFFWKFRKLNVPNSRTVAFLELPLRKIQIAKPDIHSGNLISCLFSAKNKYKIDSYSLCLAAISIHGICSPLSFSLLVLLPCPLVAKIMNKSTTNTILIIKASRQAGRQFTIKFFRNYFVRSSIFQVLATKARPPTVYVWHMTTDRKARRTKCWASPHSATQEGAFISYIRISTVQCCRACLVWHRLRTRQNPLSPSLHALFSQISPSQRQEDSTMKTGNIAKESAFKWSLFTIARFNRFKIPWHITILPPTTKLQGGNVFTTVCDSVHGGGSVQGGCLCSERVTCGWYASCWKAFLLTDNLFYFSNREKQRYFLLSFKIIPLQI